MTTLQSTIEGVLKQPCTLRVKRILSNYNPVYAPSNIVVVKAEKKPRKAMREPQYLMTNNGLMRCSLPDFDPSTYKGLKQNCGRPLSEAAKKAKLKKEFVKETTE